MSLHAPETLHFGETQTPPQTLDQTFEDAQKALYAITLEPEFEALCHKREIPFDEVHTPRYWAAVADFAHRNIGDQRADADQRVTHGQMSREERISLEQRLTVQELVASTPDFIYHQAYLERRPHGANRDTVHRAVRTVSFYNSLIRDTAARWPEATTKGLEDRLAEIVDISIEHEPLKEAAADMISQSIVGAQHELATGQILEHTGFHFRASNTDEDVIRGADYIVYRHDGREVLINVKASAYELRRHGVYGQYAYGDKGVLIVSLVSNEELGDRFSISEDLAVEKAAELRQAIGESVGHHHNHGRKHGHNRHHHGHRNHPHRHAA